MKYTVKANEKILTLSAQGIRKFLNENPDVPMSVKLNLFYENRMPPKLHNEIAEHNSKIIT